MLVNGEHNLTAAAAAASTLASSPSASPGASAPQQEERAFPSDRVEISAEAQSRLTEQSVSATVSVETVKTECEDCKNGTCTTCESTDDQDLANATELSEEEQAQVDELKARDREVRAHEAAHAAAGGAHAGSPSYEYQVGPDGQRYAVGGEVSIDIAPLEGDPRGTIAKMEQVKAAALAPAEPSGQDRKVAAQADAAIREAEAELAAQKREEQNNPDAEDDPGVVAGLVQAGPPPPELGRQAYAQAA